MQAAAENMDFELAAVLRDRLKALTFIQGTQFINAEGVGDADIFALACLEGVIGIQAFFIRGGQNWGHRSFFPSHTAEVSEEEVLQLFLMQFYEEVPPARTIFVDRELPEAALLMEALSEQAKRKVEITVPQRGTRRRLLDQATRNAKEALERRLAESTTQTRLNREVAELFELAEPPERIEVYDNSHIQGTNALGAMVVAGPEGFRKGQYRKFNIKQAATDDDFAMMREVLTRRFSRALEEDPDRDSGEWPDLVLIDGGRGQLNAARAVLDDDAAPGTAGESGDDAAHRVHRWRERTATLVGWADSTRGDWDRHLRPMLAREFALSTRQRQSKDRAAMVATGRMLFGPQLWQWVDPLNVGYAERDEPGPGRAALEEILQRMERL